MTGTPSQASLTIKSGPGAGRVIDLPQGELLIGRIELTVGRDLQYIRFNGAMIGGLAGLALHALEQGLKLVA